MNFVIPMAGRGRRFIEAGYTIPKPLLEAHGKTLLQWSVDSLPLKLASRLIFIGLSEHQSLLEPLIGECYAKYKLDFIWINKVTRGQSETVLRAASSWDEERALLVYNIDTAFYSPSIESALQRTDVDGILGAFRSNEPRFSYAQCSDGKFVQQVAEKEVISEFALTGLYHFSSTKSFILAAEEALLNRETVKGEYYIAPLYSKLIKNGMNFALDICEREAILGTPSEYLEFARDECPFLTDERNC